MAVYTRTSLSDLSNRIMDRTDGCGVYWTSDERTWSLNEAIRVWQLLTGVWSGQFSIPVTSGHYYDVPTQIIHVRRVLWNGSDLSKTSDVELDYGSPGWGGVTGTPEFWAPNGISKVIISPAPTSGNLTFSGMIEAPILTNPTDYIDMGEEELSRVLGYTQHYLSIKEGSTELESTNAPWQKFIEGAALKNRRLKSTNLYRAAQGKMLGEQQARTVSGPTEPTQNLGVR
jgi:hypothetical protein